MVKTNILDPEDDHLIQNVRVAYYIYKVLHYIHKNFNNFGEDESYIEIFLRSKCLRVYIAL